MSFGSLTYEAKRAREAKVRQYLRAHPDGVTSGEVARHVGGKYTAAARMMRAMPDVYIDRWQVTERGRLRYTPVYMLADVPEDAPMPSGPPTRTKRNT